MANGVLQHGILFIPFLVKVNQISAAEFQNCCLCYSHQFCCNLSSFSLCYLMTSLSRGFRRPLLEFSCIHCLNRCTAAARRNRQKAITSAVRLMLADPPGNYVHVHIPTVLYRSRGLICTVVLRRCERCCPVAGGHASRA